MRTPSTAAAPIIAALSVQLASCKEARGVLRYSVMKKYKTVVRSRGPRPLPLVVEKDESGFYVVECPTLPGCYTQGKTLDQALKNIQEAIALVLEEKEGRDILHDYHPREISFHTVTV